MKNAVGRRGRRGDASDHGSTTRGDERRKNRRDDDKAGKRCRRDRRPFGVIERLVPEMAMLDAEIEIDRVFALTGHLLHMLAARHCLHGLTRTLARLFLLRAGGFLRAGIGRDAELCEQDSADENAA